MRRVVVLSLPHLGVGLEAAIEVTGIPDTEGPVAVTVEEPVTLIEAIDHAVAAPAGQVHRPSNSLLHQFLVRPRE